MHRVYHLSRVPTFNRKARVLAEWTLSGLFKREIVSLGSLEHPRAEFELAAGGGRPANGSKEQPPAGQKEGPKEQSADGSPDGPKGT
jgi:NADH dehydrogenase